MHHLDRSCVIVGFFLKLLRSPTPKGANKVCKLQRSIYGLVQASRSWNKRFDSVIKAYGFIQSFGEACIYKKVSGSSVAFLILYVDDISLIGNNIEFLDSIKDT